MPSFLLTMLLVAGQMPLLPEPAPAAVQESLKLIADVYKTDYAAAKTPQQKVDLAKKLLQDAAATRNDPEGQFALYRAARNMAAQEGDITTAYDAIDQAAKRFQIDAAEQKVTAAESCLKAARTNAARISLLPFLSRLLDEAIERDNFVVAKKTIALANDAANQAKEFKTARIFTQRKAAIEADELEYAKVTAALTTLEKSPTDAAANGVVGAWYCLKKDDWKRGLNYLALSSDKSLSKLAQLELQPPQNPDDQFNLAEAWWTAAQSQDTEKQSLEGRSRHWYYKMYPTLSGLTQAKVRQRLTESFVWELDSPLHQEGFVPHNFCGLGLKPKGPPQFRYSEQADAVVLTGGAIIAPHLFTSITSADLTLGLPAGSKGVTIAVGQASMILNWGENKNHFRYAENTSWDNTSAPTSPFALVPGRFHVVTVREQDGTITVSVDGKQHWTRKGTLHGTISVAARFPEGNVLLKKITVQGVRDPNHKPTRPDPENLY
jgi:hypothetical protein